MKEKLKLVLLVDDYEGANFLHTKVINETGLVKNVHVENSAMDALNYLQTKTGDSYPQPEIIFLDLNMPGMNGWDFLEEFKELTREQRWGTLIVILTTSKNPDDEAKARVKHPKTVFMNKPLLRQTLELVTKEYFSDRF